LKQEQKLFFSTQILNAMKLIRPINFSFILLISFFVALLSSCAYNQQYTYDIRLERPIQSNNLLFENDTMSISFVFGTDVIGLELYNKLDDAIKINGRDLSASVNGDTKTIWSSAYKRPAMIAPRSKTKIYLQIYDIPYKRQELGTVQTIYFGIKGQENHHLFTVLRQGRLLLKNI
jgi:hypothetical protein